MKGMGVEGSVQQIKASVELLDDCKQQIGVRGKQRSLTLSSLHKVE